MNSRRPIIVAIQNDERDEKLLKHAVHLGKTFDAPIHVVHSFEGRVGYIPSPIIGDEYLEFLEHSYNEEFRACSKSIEEKAKSIGATSRTFTGAPCPGIVAEAKALDALMVLVGSRAHGHRFLPKSLSVPLTLFNNSPVPVMVVSDGVDEGWASRLHILSADDLTGANPTEFAANLVHRMGRSASLTVLHANPLTETTIKAGLDSALAASYSQPNGPIDAHEIFLNVDSQLKELMRQRIPKKFANLEVSHQILHGQPDIEIRNAIEEAKPLLTVFGQHRSVHKNPFYFGRIPFSTAFSLHSPFIVVPY